MYLVEYPEQPKSEFHFRGRYFTTAIQLDPYFIYKANPEQRIAISLHFSLIRRALLEKMLDPNGPEYTYWFEYREDQGEDVTFSVNAALAGAKMGMSTRLKVGHGGYHVMGWDTVVEYLDRKRAVERGDLALPSTAAMLLEHQALRDLSALVAEYMNSIGIQEPVELVMAKSTSGAGMVADRWQLTKPATSAEVREFYDGCREYLYDLVRWNVWPPFQRLLRLLSDVQAERVLDFGGGLGTVSEYLFAHGNQVDYFDISTEMQRFAAWRFNRITSPTRPRIVGAWQREHYHRVIAVDVIEHVHPDEFDDTLDRLAEALVPGGLLFAHNNFKGPSELYPQHFDHAARFEAFLARHRFEQTRDFEWRKP
jgi:hypothetical protein